MADPFEKWAADHADQQSQAAAGSNQLSLVIQNPFYPGLSTPTSTAPGVRVERKQVVGTQDQGYAYWYDGMSDEQRAAWGREAYNLGLLDDPRNYEGAFAVWKKAVDESARFYSLGGKQVSPWETLGIMSNLQGGRGQAGGFGGGYTGPRERTTHSTSVDIPDETTIKSGVNQIFQKELGRNATDAEIAKYTSFFRAAAKKNPKKSTTTTTYDSYGAPINTSTVTSGGVDLGQIGTDKAQADPEYGAYQAATTYWNALAQALGSA